MSKTIEFEKNSESLLLVYTPMDGVEWLKERLEESGVFTIQKTFSVKPEHQAILAAEGREIFDVDDSDYRIRFKIASLENHFYCFDKDILSIEYELRIHEDVKLDHRSFTAVRNVSIFSRINKLIVNSTLTIGGEFAGDGYMSSEEFLQLTSRFPNTYELDRYVNARVSAELKERFELKRDYESLYHSYLNRKLPKTRSTGVFNSLKKYEVLKYRELLRHLKGMLDDEHNYSERQWQNEIIQFILLLFPKYLYAFIDAPVDDARSGKKRGLDFLLVDYSGNIDIVEIKKPFEKGLVTKSGYRDNYIPLRELSGTIMQIEKYIFYLMKSGAAGEKKLTEKYSKDMHPDFQIRINNPMGMVISGRTNNMTEQQIGDFEIIKRKYKTIADILSYDDLLNRLEYLIVRLESGS